MLPGSMSSRQVVYGVVVGVHALSSVLGFGAIGVSGVSAGALRPPLGPSQLAEARRYFRRRSVPGRTLWLVPVAGYAALALGSSDRSPGQPWVLIGAATWLLAIVLAAQVIWPAEARISTLLEALVEAGGGGDAAPGGSPDVVWRDIGASRQRLVRASAVCDVSFVVASVSMLFRFGHG